MKRVFYTVIAAQLLLSGCERSPETAHCITTKGYGEWKDISERKVENYCPEVAECIEQKGYGHWYGSLGVTLQQFCTATVALEVIEQDRKSHPENY